MQYLEEVVSNVNWGWDVVTKLTQCKWKSRFIHGWKDMLMFRFYQTCGVEIRYMSKSYILIFELYAEND